MHIQKLNGQGKIKKATSNTMLNDVTSVLIEGVQNLLNQKSIDFTVREHAPIYTIEEGKALNLPDIDKAAKSLFITDDKHESFYMIVLPLDKHLDLKALRQILVSRRLTMANEDELGEILGLEPGSVTPLGMLMDEEHQVQLYIDNALKGQIVAVPLFTNTQTIWLDCDQLLSLLESLGHGGKYIEI